MKKNRFSMVVKLRVNGLLSQYLERDLEKKNREEALLENDILT